MEETKTGVVNFAEEVKKIPDRRWCPLQEGTNCDGVDCAWYITDSGKEECAIVKLAKGWQL